MAHFPYVSYRLVALTITGHGTLVTLPLCYLEFGRIEQYVTVAKSSLEVIGI